MLLKPFFAYFVNFDDLWLFVYHEKKFNIAVNNLFHSIR